MPLPLIDIFVKVLCRRWMLSRSDSEATLMERSSIQESIMPLGIVLCRGET